MPSERHRRRCFGVARSQDPPRAAPLRRWRPLMLYIRTLNNIVRQLHALVMPPLLADHQQPASHRSATPVALSRFSLAAAALPPHSHHSRRRAFRNPSPGLEHLLLRRSNRIRGALEHLQEGTPRTRTNSDEPATTPQGQMSNAGSEAVWRDQRRPHNWRTLCQLNRDAAPGCALTRGRCRKSLWASRQGRAAGGSRTEEGAQCSVACLSCCAPPAWLRGRVRPRRWTAG